MQPGAQADRDVERVLEVELVARRAMEDPRQVLAVDVLHREEVFAVLEPDVVDLRDVGVVETRDQAGLVEQHPHEPLVGRLVGQDPLERARSSRARVDGAEHLRHRALVKTLVESVRAERPALRALLARPRLAAAAARRKRQDEYRRIGADKALAYQYLLNSSMIAMVRSANAIT